jgi:hypothetical protein
MVLLDIFSAGSSHSIFSHSWWNILVYKSYISYSRFSIIKYEFQRENSVYVSSTLLRLSIPTDTTCEIQFKYNYTEQWKLLSESITRGEIIDDKLI